MSIAGLVAGLHGALSALLGGLVNVLAGAVFGWVATRGARRKTMAAGEAMLVVFRAEGVKIALIVMQLWLVLAHYKQIVLTAFFGTFVLTVILFSMAIFVRNR